MNIMKTSLILFVTATAVHFFTLLGLSGIAALSIMTALGVAAVVGLDYGKNRELGFDVKTVSVATARPVAKTTAETHPLAA